MNINKKLDSLYESIQSFNKFGNLNESQNENSVEWMDEKLYNKILKDAKKFGFSNESDTGYYEGFCDYVHEGYDHLPIFYEENEDNPLPLYKSYKGLEGEELRRMIEKNERIFERNETKFSRYLRKLGFDIVYSHDVYNEDDRNISYRECHIESII